VGGALRRIGLWPVSGLGLSSPQFIITEDQEAPGLLQAGTPILLIPNTAFGFIVSQTYGPESKDLPPAWVIV
jgi:hypothetical protein